MFSFANCFAVAGPTPARDSTVTLSSFKNIAYTGRFATMLINMLLMKVKIMLAATSETMEMMRAVLYVRFLPAVNVFAILYTRGEIDESS